MDWIIAGVDWVKGNAQPGDAANLSLGGGIYEPLDLAVQNYGNPPVDFCAPGYSIYSCYKNGGYATMSGTSMAAPHVAGLLLLGTVKADGTVNGDPDGNADPIAHH